MSQIDNSGLLFNVQEDKLFTASGAEVPKKKALINVSNGKVMSVVSENYKVVTNDEIFSGFCKSVERSGIDAEGATVNIRQTSDGARAMVDFVFPNQLLRVGSDDSTTALQLCALNSFDGSTRYLTKAGGLRMKCLNGQIVGNIIGAYSSTHTAKLDVDAGADSVISMIEQFNKAADYWGQMMQTKVSSQTAFKVFMNFLGIKIDSPIQHNEHGVILERNNARLERCTQLWGQYKMELGENAYAVYNVLTHYCSHQNKAYKNPTNSAMHQRRQLERVLNTSPVFEPATATFNRKMEVTA
jgi:hypothetical protein